MRCPRCGHETLRHLPDKRRWVCEGKRTKRVRCDFQCTAAFFFDDPWMIELGMRPQLLTTDCRRLVEQRLVDLDDLLAEMGAPSHVWR